jgi:hypothetical protein
MRQRTTNDHRAQKKVQFTTEIWCSSPENEMQFITKQKGQFDRKKGEVGARSRSAPSSPQKEDAVHHKAVTAWYVCAGKGLLSSPIPWTTTSGEPSDRQLLNYHNCRNYKRARTLVGLELQQLGNHPMDYKTWGTIP